MQNATHASEKNKQNKTLLKAVTTTSTPLGALSAEELMERNSGRREKADRPCFKQQREATPQHGNVTFVWLFYARFLPETLQSVVLCLPVCLSIEQSRLHYDAVSAPCLAGVSPNEAHWAAVALCLALVGQPCSLLLPGSKPLETSDASFKGLSSSISWQLSDSD